MIKKGFKRDLLLFLATLGDFYREISYDTAYKRLYWPDYKPVSITQMVSRMVRVKEIEKRVNKKGEVVLKLTTKGGRILDETIPLRRWQRKRWDGRWRMVIFDIEEIKRNLRDALRHKLKSLGFGMWQRSVYITPHDVFREMNEFLESKGLREVAVCLEVKRLGGDERVLAAKAFRLLAINKDYEWVADRSEELSWELSEGKISPKKAKRQFRKIWEKYREVQLKDPYLPKELLGEDWFAGDARKEFNKLARLLRK